MSQQEDEDPMREVCSFVSRSIALSLASIFATPSTSRMKSTT